MPEYGTIKIPKDAYDRHNERRKEAGLTWEKYIDREAVTVEYETHDHNDVKMAAKKGAQEAIEEAQQ